MTATRAMTTALLTALAFLAGPAGGDDGKTFHHAWEAEAFDNIPSYGNWHPAAGTGWYIKEHVHATSQGIGVCDAHNVGALLFKALDKPLPAGIVKTYVRMYAMRGGGENAIEVALGNGTGPAFQPVASFEARWGDGPSGYFWLGQSLKLDAPCTTIRIKAVEAGRTGIGDNPEQEYGMIWFDQIYLSNDPAVTLKENPRGGQLVRPQTARPKHQPTAAHTRAAAWLQGNTPNKLPTPPDKGNLLFNGGFELGFEPWWFTPDANAASTAFHLAWEDLRKGAARHGRYGLAAKLEKRHGSYVGLLARRPFLVRGGTKYVLTFWARTAGPDATASVSFRRPKAQKYSTAAYADPWSSGWPAMAGGEVELGSDWKRCTIPVTTEAKQEVMYFEMTLGSKEPATVHLDSFMLAPAAGRYAQREPVEAAIHSRKLGRAHYNNGPLQMVLAASSQQDGAGEVSVTYEIVDLAGAVVQRGQETIQVDGPGTFEKRIALPFRRRGAYLFRSRAGRKAAWEQFAFNVIAPPLPPEQRLAEPFITTIGNLSEPNCAVHAAGGYDGFCTLEGGAFMPIIGPQRLKEDGSIDFADADVARAREHGMALIGYIVPWTWGRYNKHEWIPTHTVELTGSVVLALDAYTDYVRRTIEHFPKVRWWILEDEADMHWGVASEFAPWVKRLHAVAKKANPDAMIMFSMMPQMFEELAETIGPEHNEGVGGSFHNNDPWFHYRVRDLLDRYNKDYSIDIGVGWTCPPTPSLLDRWNGYRPGRGQRVANTAFRVTGDLIAQQAIVNYTHQSRYTSHLHWVHGWSFGMDDSWHAGSAAFVNILQFLRGAERGGMMMDVHASGLRAYQFTKDGRLHVALVPTAWFDTTRVTLDLEPEQVEVLDRDVNPVKLEGKTVTLPFEPNQLYILRPAEGTSGKALRKAVREMKAERVVWARTMALPGENGGLDYAVYVRNDSPQAMDGVLRVQHGNLQNPADTMRRLTVPAGRGKLVRFPLAETFAGDRSFGLVLDNFAYTDGQTFYRSNKGGWRSAAGMWIAKALPATGERNVRLDGKLDEWQSQSGAYIYLSWAQDGSYGRRQGVRNAHLVDSSADASATVRVRHDNDNLYLAVDVQDDRITGDGRAADESRGDRVDCLVVHLDTEFLKDIDGASADDDDVSVALYPDAEPRARLRIAGVDMTPPTVDADLGPADRAPLRPLDCQIVRHRGGWSGEVAVPWGTLGGRFNVAGLNVELHDVDDPKDGTAVLRWASSADRADDPRGWGQLIVRPAD